MSIGTRGESGVLSLRRVGADEAPELRAFLADRWPHTVRFLGQIDEEGGRFGLWWTDRWPRPRAVLCRGRVSFCLYAADEESAERIFDGIDWRGEVRLSGLEHRFLPLVRRRAKEISENPCGMYRVEREGFRPVPAPEGAARRVEPLRPEDAPLITRHWPYGDDESYPLSRIRSAPSACIRVGGRPAAWALIHYGGDIGMVHTLEEHRRKGFARQVVSALTEERFRAGRTPFCFIVDGNRASQRLFEGLGFFRQADLSWVLCAPREDQSETAPGGPRCDR